MACELNSIRPVNAIGVVCVSILGGGAERATYIWARRRAAEGRKIVWFCDKRWTEAVRARLQADGFDWPVIALDAFDRQERERLLREGIQWHSIDSVLLPDHWWDLIFCDLQTAKNAGCRVIVAEHNAFHFPLENVDFDLYRQRDRFYPLADVVTVLSPENVAWWKASGHGDNIVYMPNYLTFDPQVDAGGRRNPAECELLYAGRICERKGAHLVLEAVRVAYERHGLKNVHLTFLGRFETPEFEHQMRELVAKAGLSSAVSFPGQVDDVEPYFQKATVFLMGSRIEGAPMVLMEAKSKAIPSVIFEMPYVDGTHDGQGVVAVPYGNVKAMAKAIFEVVTNETLWRRLSLEAVESLAEFTAEKIDRRWQRVFDSLEKGTPLESGAPAVSAERMFPLVVTAVSQSLGPMAEWQRVAQREHLELCRIKVSKAYRLYQAIRKIALPGI